MLGDALANAFSDLATGFGTIGLIVLLGLGAYFVLALACSGAVYLLRGGQEGYERREAKKLPAELKELERQRRDEIRCMGGRRHLETPR